MINRLIAAIISLFAVETEATPLQNNHKLSGSSLQSQQESVYSRQDATPLNSYPSVSHIKDFPRDELIQLNDSGISTLTRDYQSLDKEALEALLPGKTVYGLTFKKTPYALYFSQDNKAILHMEDGREEVGHWYIDSKSNIHAKWPTISNGKEHVVEYRVHRDKNYLIKLNPITKKFSVLLLKNRKPVNHKVIQ